MNEVTFVLTSCGRFDLLEKTLTTFLKFNTYPIKQFLIIEDSINKDVFKIKEKFPFVNIIFNDEKLGQMKSIDKAYDLVNTKYIFHCEDDWEFYESSFIEKSLEILESNEKILQVWIRSPQDHQHPLIHPIYSISNAKYAELLPMWQNTYSGFSFNPGLRRKKDYDLIKPFYRIGGETRVGIVYSKIGYKFVSLLEGYCRHIGYHAHVEDPEVSINRDAFYNFDVGDPKRFLNE